MNALKRFQTVNKGKPLYDGSFPAYSKDSKTLFYGLYPQTHVSDEKLISELEKLTPLENGWCLYKGNYYVKIFGKPSPEMYTVPPDCDCETAENPPEEKRLQFDDRFSDGTLFKPGDAFWFKCEPIEWLILDRLDAEGACFVISKLVLDTRRFSGISDNYRYSEIREWLNNDFYQKAFPLNESYILTTEIDNSLPPTRKKRRDYKDFLPKLKDKVFLLSVEDYNDPKHFDDDAPTLCGTTDWVMANGGDIYRGHLGYWTRTANSKDYLEFPLYPMAVTSSGVYARGRIALYEGGVRPALRIKLPKED